MRPPANEEAASRLVPKRRPTRSKNPDGAHSTAQRERTSACRRASRRYRAPFPRLPLRRFTGWPAGLLAALENDWRPEHTGGVA